MAPGDQQQGSADPTTDPTAVEYTGPGTLAGRY